MHKYILILSIVLAISFGLEINAYSDYYTTDDVIDELVHLGIVCGDENGDLKLNDPITRAEFATVFAKVLWLNREAFSKDLNGITLSNSPNPFTDINSSDWFYGYALILDLNSIPGFSSNSYSHSSHLFNPFGYVIGSDLREAFVIYTFEHYTYQIVYEKTNFENVTRLHYPHYSVNNLTRKQAFLMVWDMMNETVNDMITYETDEVFIYPNHVLVHEDIIEADGNSKHYITPLIRGGYSRIYGNVVLIAKGQISFNVTESKNLQNQAYGQEYNNQRTIAVKGDCSDLELGEDYYLLIKENNLNKDEFELIYASKNRPTEPYRTDIWEEE